MSKRFVLVLGLVWLVSLLVRCVCVLAVYFLLTGDRLPFWNAVGVAFFASWFVGLVTVQPKRS